MFAKKFVLVLLGLLLTSALTAQTKVIAFRSHSGNMNYFSSAEPDNLGLAVDFEVDTVVRISDTSCVEIRGFKNHYRIHDTIYHSTYTDTNYTMEDLNLYYPNVVFLGYDSIKKNIPVADTLVKPKERIHGRNDTKENEVAPISPTDNNNPINHFHKAPLFQYFVAVFSGVLIFVGFFIWMSNRKKITIS